MKDRKKLLSLKKELEILKSENALLKDELSQRQKTEGSLALDKIISKSFPSFLNETPIGIVFADHTGKITNANSYYCEISGYNLDELRTMNFRQLSHDEDLETELEFIQKLNEKEIDSYSIEKQLLKKDKSKVWIKINVTPIFDSNDIAGYFGIAEKIQLQKDIEESYKESENRFRTLINSTPDYICLKDNEGRWLISNKANLSFFNLSNIDYFGKTDEELISYSPEYREALLNCAKTDEIAWEKGEISSIMEEIPSKDGKTQFINVIKAPLFHEDGSRKSLVVIGRDYTELINTRKQSEESETETRQFFDNLPGIVALKNEKLQFEYVNKFTSDLANESQKWFRTKTDDDVFRDKSIANEMKVISNKVLSEQKSYKVNVIRIRDYQDNPRYFQGLFFPYNTRNRRMVGLFANEVTDKQIATEEKEKSQRELELIFNSAPSIMMLVDENSNVLKINKSGIKYAQSDEEDTVKKAGGSFLNCIHAIHNSMECGNSDACENCQIRNSINRTFREGEDADKLKVDLNISTITGVEKRYFLLSTKLFRNESPKTALITLEDISNLVKTEKELEESETRFKTQYDHFPHPIYSWEYRDGDFYLVETNKATYVKTNDKVNTIFGSKASDFWKDEPDLLEKIRDCYFNKTNLSFEREYKFKATQRTEIVKATYIYVPPKHVFIITEDITEQKSHQQELLKEKNRAEESDRLKSSFLTTMSHELRTPLNAVIGFSDLIDDETPKDQILDFNKIINDNGKHLLDIIESVFDISSIETEQVEFKYENFGVNSMFSELQNILNNELIRTNKSSIKASLEIPSETDNIILFTDKTKLKQIFVNLIINAVKFTEEGTISIGYEKHDDEMLFFVKDSGIGIKKEMHEMIFDQFRRVDESHTRKYGGVGLGLSICKKLVKLLQGELWVDSEEGKGSKFYVRFNQLVAKQPKSAIKDQPQMIESHFLKDLKILVAEDEESNFYLVKTILHSFDCGIHHAQDGLEAIDMFTKNKYDLILMDLKMPGKNGYEATEEIRRINKDIPIIALTAYAMIGDRDKAIEAGCNDYLTKPIKKNTLLDMLAKYLDDQTY